MLNQTYEHHFPQMPILENFLFFNFNKKLKLKLKSLFLKNNINITKFL